MSDKAFKLEKKMEIVPKLYGLQKKNVEFSLTAPSCNFLWAEDCESIIITNSSSSREQNHLQKSHIIAFSDVLLICELRKLKYKIHSYILLDNIEVLRKMIINGSDGVMIFSSGGIELQIIPTESSSSQFFDNLQSISKAIEDASSSGLFFFVCFAFLFVIKFTIF